MTAANSLRITPLSYPLGTGLLELRKKIAQLYTTVCPEHVVLFNGAEEAVYILMRSLLQKNDEIIVQYPCFQSLFAVAKDMGCRVVKARLEIENNWKLDLDAVEAAVTSRTKMLVLNSPHNPTGACFSKSECARIVEICKKHNLLLLSDEVYRFLTIQENANCTSFADAYEHTVALGSFSKTFAAPGIRVGWAATKNQELIRKISVYRDFVSICLNTVSQLGAMRILDDKDSILDRNNQIIRKNEALLFAFMQKHQDRLRYVRPVACSTAYVQLLGESSSAFCLDILEKTGVLFGSLAGDGRAGRLHSGRPWKKKLPHCA